MRFWYVTVLADFPDCDWGPPIGGNRMDGELGAKKSKIQRNVASRKDIPRFIRPTKQP